MCPTQQCKTPNIVYQTNVSVPSNDTGETYVGITTTLFPSGTPPSAYKLSQANRSGR